MPLLDIKYFNSMNLSCTADEEITPEYLSFPARRQNS